MTEKEVQVQRILVRIHPHLFWRDGL
ncbi:hypothetical protein C5167_023363 [Papaver somniferum]|uniref:Uncharacterized protein n=1 Tax=Papaver somniferum TaxID=3469 RepID=A0A4Y7JLI2_PAPSO|nr:hypothetical protein C5167_023363 [Papaver somniferum]